MIWTASRRSRCSPLEVPSSSSFFSIAPIGQRLKSALQEDFFYFAMLRCVSCFPSCQEGFFNVELQLFGDQFRFTWELDFWPTVFSTNWNLELWWSTSHLDIWQKFECINLEEKLKRCTMGMPCLKWWFFRFKIPWRVSSHITKGLDLLNRVLLGISN